MMDRQEGSNTAFRLKRNLRDRAFTALELPLTAAGPATDRPFPSSAPKAHVTMGGACAAVTIKDVYAVIFKVGVLFT